jgi:hypothetical protein
MLPAAAAAGGVEEVPVLTGGMLCCCWLSCANDWRLLLRCTAAAPHNAQPVRQLPWLLLAMLPALLPARCGATFAAALLLPKLLLMLPALACTAAIAG